MVSQNFFEVFGRYNQMHGNHLLGFSGNGLFVIIQSRYQSIASGAHGIREEHNGALHITANFGGADFGAGDLILPIGGSSRKNMVLSQNLGVHGVMKRIEANMAWVGSRSGEVHGNHSLGGAQSLVGQQLIRVIFRHSGLLNPGFFGELVIHDHGEQMAVEHLHKVIGLWLKSCRRT